MKSKAQTEYNKKRKKVNQLKILVVALVTLSLLSTGQYLIALALVSGLYILNEILWSDHIFYDVRQDYRYNFEQARVSDLDLKQESFTIKAPVPDHTLFISLNFKSKLKGRIFDPFITVTSGKEQFHYYLERGGRGLRWIDISPFTNTGEPIYLKFNHCRLASSKGALYAFPKPLANNNTALILSPHADDAELAAFGLSQDFDTSILTITAGELEEGPFNNYYQKKQDASLFKGKVRAWDSIAVPLWTGLKSHQVANLGYFCLTLKQMENSPNQPVKSLVADVNDTRVFREFNQIAFNTDDNGLATWNNLISDLCLFIDKHKPDVILSPHPVLDPHIDHQYTTMALADALNHTEHKPNSIMLYMNHQTHTDMFPFGPAHTHTSLPPWFDDMEIGSGLYSHNVPSDTQKRKAMALQCMHDLQTPIKFKRKIRGWLSSKLINRPLSPYGDDEYFTKAIRSNEIFITSSATELKDWRKGLPNTEAAS